MTFFGEGKHSNASSSGLSELGPRTGRRQPHGHYQPERLVVPIARIFRLDDFQLGKTVGTGTFGRVRMAKYAPANKHFVMKIMKKCDILRLNQVDHVFSERNILASVAHPFIVRLFCTFQDTYSLYMLLEYVIGGELFTYLRRLNKFSMSAARFYASELVLALEHLHSRGIVYRDLKPENLLLDTCGHLKIADFGFAKCIDDQRTWTLCGTPEYLSPEIIQNKGHGMAVDWWALGILIYEMLFGSPPYYDTSSYKIYEKILAGNLYIPPATDAVTSDLLQRLLCPDPALRLGSLQGGSQDIRNHAWFAGVDWSAVLQRSLPAPIVPQCRHPGDTSNFDNYPESDVEPVASTTIPLSNWQHCFDGY